MRKLKLAWVLPAIQFVISAALLQWAYRATAPRGLDLYVPTGRLICRGLNAPALLFIFLDPAQWGRLAPAWAPRSAFGFYTDDLCFLVGVIFVWFLVGRAIDRRRRLRTAESNGVFPAYIAPPLLLALGGVLLYGALRELGVKRDNVYAPVGGLLMLMWALSLIFLSGKLLVVAIRGALRVHTPTPKA